MLIGVFALRHDDLRRGWIGRGIDRTSRMVGSIVLVILIDGAFYEEGVKEGT